MKHALFGARAAVMDVDTAPLSGGLQVSAPTLKRSCSAPMINQLSSGQQVACTARSPVNCRYSTPSLSLTRRRSGGQRSSFRVRRFSATFASTPPPVSPGSSSGVRTPSRLMQIRHEEGLEEREIRHERTVHAALVMSQSCEDLVLSGDDSDPPSKSHVQAPASQQQLACRLTDPLHLTMPGTGSGAAPFSPTRGGLASNRHCLSPSLLFAGGGCRSGGVTPVAAGCLAFSPSPSPSPTRRTSISRRSMSPITLRPSPLGGAAFSAGGPFKRKWSVCDSDDAPCAASGGASAACSTQKRFNSGGSAVVMSPACLLMSPSSMSVGASSCEPGLAQHQQQQLVVSATDTPDSLSSAGSPCVASFKPDSPGVMPAVPSSISSSLHSLHSVSVAASPDRMFRPLHAPHDVAMETGGAASHRAVAMDTGGCGGHSSEQGSVSSGSHAVSCGESLKHSSTAYSSI